MNITNGTVSIEDGKKAKEEYAPARKVNVSISFAVEEGSDGHAAVTAAGDLANTHVNRLLGVNVPLNSLSGFGPVAPKEAAAPAETPAQKKARIAAEKAAGKEKTKDDLAAEAGVPNKDTVHKGATATDDLGEDEPAKPAAPVKDELDDILGDTAPAPVTDAELGKAAQEKNGKMKEVAGWAPAKIRDLVGKFVQEGGKPKAGAKLSEVPAAVRHQFLKELEALK